VILEPGKIFDGGAADIAARRDLETTDYIVKATRIDEPMLVITGNGEFVLSTGDGSPAEMTQNQLGLRELFRAFQIGQ
jgi:hypothetical protein